MRMGHKTFVLWGGGGLGVDDNYAASELWQIYDFGCITSKMYTGQGRSLLLE